MNPTSTSLKLTVPFSLKDYDVSLTGLIDSSIPSCSITKYTLKKGYLSDTTIDNKVGDVMRLDGDKLTIVAKRVANHTVYIKAETLGNITLWYNLTIEIIDSSDSSFKFEPVLPLAKPINFVTDLPKTVNVTFENAAQFGYISPLLN